MIQHMDQIAEEFISQDTHGLITKAIGAAAGSERLYVNSYPVTKGDFFAKPSGQNIAHSIYNFGDTDLILLDIGTVEQEDTCYYPDEDMYLLKSNGQRRIISGSDFNNEWTTEPNADEAGDTL